MAKNKNQSGSAVLIVIIILAVALLGAVGYIGYQELAKSNEPEAVEVETTVETTVLAEPTTTVETTVATTVDDTVPAVADGDFLTITQWGIKGVYSGSNAVDYLISSPNNLEFTSPDSPSQCTGRVLKIMNRYSSGDQITVFGHLAVDPPISVEAAFAQWSRSKITKIGSYYYTLDQGITDTCSDVESNVYQGVVNFFLSLTAAW